MAQEKASNNERAPLVWVDMEMSGLVPDRDRILAHRSLGCAAVVALERSERCAGHCC